MNAKFEPVASIDSSVPQQRKSHQPVTGVVDNHRLSISLPPDLTERIVPSLESRMRQYQASPAGSLAESIDFERYYQLGDEGQLETRLGMLPLIEQALVAAGYQLELQQQGWYWPAHFFVDSQVAHDPRVTGDLKLLLAAALRNPAGVVAAQQQEVPYVIAMLANFYRSAGVFVVSRSKAGGCIAAAPDVPVHRPPHYAAGGS